MKITEAIEHLQERARVQRTEKTSYNRLRWNGRDLEAVETLLSALAGARPRNPVDPPRAAEARSYEPR